MADTVYRDFDEALEILNEGQYGRDVRQAINDCLVFLTGTGAGAIDLTARNAVSNLQRELNAAIYDMNVHAGRVELATATLTGASATVTMSNAFTDFDEVWIHLSDVPSGSSNAYMELPNTSFRFPVPLPRHGDVDIFIRGIMQDKCLVEVAGGVSGGAAVAGGTNKSLFYEDEYVVAYGDTDGHALNLSTRIIRFTNISGASVHIVGHGGKSGVEGVTTGLVLDEYGVVHLV